MEAINEKTIERLCVYRRLLRKLAVENKTYFYSHDLAQMAHVTSVQVRRDLMNIGYTGNNRKGYEIKGILESIGEILDCNGGMKICIAGVGNLGRALINFFADKSEKLTITALFDIDPKIVGKTYIGIPCYHVNSLKDIVEKNNIAIGIISSSSSSAVQIANEMVSAGITSVINFTPTPLDMPENTFLEEMDITTSIEKASYFAKMIRKQNNGSKNQKTVLIIDDDIDIVNAYTVVLTANGFKPVHALNCAEGFSMIKKHKPDLIILDIMMEKPDSGFLFLNELKEKNITTPVILSSSIAKATANILDVSQLKIKTILQKPVDIDELIQNIKKFI